MGGGGAAPIPGICMLRQQDIPRPGGTLVPWEGVAPRRPRAGCSEMKGARLPGPEGGLEGAQSTEVRGQEQVGDREVAEFSLDMLT